MIDTARAKHLRDQAVRLVRSEGRVQGNIETKGLLRRLIQYERGRLFIEYLSPRYPDNPLPKTARPRAYMMLVRFNGLKVLSVAWDHTRTAVTILKPGDWEQRLRTRRGASVMDIFKTEALSSITGREGFIIGESLATALSPPGP